MKRSLRRTFVVMVVVRSETGAPPTVRTICGDTVFISLEYGMTARWSVRPQKERKRRMKQSGDSSPSAEGGERE